MTGPDPGNSAADELVLHADNWDDILLADLPPEHRDLLGDLDRGIIFDALVAFAAQQAPEEMEVERTTAEQEMRADAPWMVPGTRIHVRARSSGAEALKRGSRLAAVFAATGAASPEAGFVGLGFDLVLTIIERTSRLDNTDAEIARSLIELRRITGGRLPQEVELREYMPPVEDLTARLDALKERGVVRGGPDGWEVSF